MRHARKTALRASCAYITLDTQSALFYYLLISKYFSASPAVTGALFAIRRKATIEMGGFSGNYFFSCEGNEYCQRAWKTNGDFFMNQQDALLALSAGHVV